MDALAHTKVILQKGNYEVHVTADVAFLITFGFVTLAKAEKDLQLLAERSGVRGMPQSCPAEVDSSKNVPAVVFEDSGSQAGK